MIKLEKEQIEAIQALLSQMYPGIPIGTWGDSDAGVYVMVLGPSDGNQVQMVTIANAMLASALVNKVMEVMMLQMPTASEREM